ncbi:MAG: DUF418 domain-containing protein [Planctomycetota bacterium]
MSQPIPVHQRIEVMDVLRGVAVLGILIVNIYSFALPIDALFELTDEGNHNVIDAWVFAFISLFCGGKFMSMFAMLFGAGVALMVDRRRQRGEPVAGLHYRRIALLAAVGLMHGLLIWYGDILLPYAICSAVLFPLLYLSTRKLVWVGLGVWVIVLMISMVYGLFTMWAESTAAEGQNVARLFQDETERMRGGWWSVMEVRFIHWLVFMLIGPFFHFPWILALMITGALAKRSGWIDGGRPRGDYLRLMVVSVVIGLPIASARVALVLWADTSFLTALELPMFVIDGTLLSIAWGSAVVLLVQAGALARLRRALVAVGRMALTNYLTQSLICTTLFYGYGFALFGSLSRSELLLIVLAIWLFQLLWSPWWLARHERGPLEAVWRRITYGPGKKEAAGLTNPN